MLITSANEIQSQLINLMGQVTPMLTIPIKQKNLKPEIYNKDTTKVIINLILTKQMNNSSR